MLKKYFVELGEHFFTDNGFCVCVGNGRFEVHDLLKDDENKISEKIFTVGLSDSDVRSMIYDNTGKNYDVFYRDYEYVKGLLYDVVTRFNTCYAQDDDVEEYKDYLLNSSLDSFEEFNLNYTSFIQLLQDKELINYWENFSYDYNNSYNAKAKELIKEMKHLYYDFD